jgi:hypothetical protein
MTLPEMDSPTQARAGPRLCQVWSHQTVPLADLPVHVCSVDRLHFHQSAAPLMVLRVHLVVVSL